MIAETIAGMIRERVQIFHTEPLQDGFADDPPGRMDSTKILPWMNVVYTTDCVLEGIFQCWHALILTVGKVSYNYSGKFTYVHQMYLLDGDGNKHDLCESEPPRTHGDPYFRSRVSGRPSHVEFMGNFLAFNKTPDQAYVAYFLADTMPTPMVLRTDTPRFLDEPNHMTVVSGGAYYIAQMALGAPDMNDFKFRRYGEIKSEYEYRRKHTLDTVTARNLYNRTTPVMKDYRERSTRLR